MTRTWPTPQNVKQPYLYLKFRLKGTVPHTPPPPPPKILSSCLMTDRVYPVCLLDNPIKGSMFWVEDVDPAGVINLHTLQHIIHIMVWVGTVSSKWTESGCQWRLCMLMSELTVLMLIYMFTCYCKGGMSVVLSSLTPSFLLLKWLYILNP